MIRIVPFGSTDHDSTPVIFGAAAADIDAHAIEPLFDGAALDRI